MLNHDVASDNPIPFGDLLRRFRLRQPGERSTGEWLGNQLGFSKATISKWETGYASRRLPNRQEILTIAELYGLNSKEADSLLAAARTDSHTRPDEAALLYPPLTPEEARHINLLAHDPHTFTPEQVSLYSKIFRALESNTSYRLKISQMIAETEEISYSGYFPIDAQNARLLIRQQIHQIRTQLAFNRYLHGLVLELHAIIGDNPTRDDLTPIEKYLCFHFFQLFNYAIHDREHDIHEWRWQITKLRSRLYEQSQH